MAVNLWSTETRYVANQMTFLRGDPDDVLSVGVYHNVDPDVVPEVADFTPVIMVQAPDPLAEGSKIDLLSLIGPHVPAHLQLNPGIYQRWGYVQTPTEKLLFKIDMITVTGPIVIP